MKFEYECWKCGEWHKTDFEGFTASLSYGFAKTRISILGLPVVIPNFVGEYEMWKWKRELNGKLKRCSECGKLFRPEMLWIANDKEQWCKKCA